MNLKTEISRIKNLPEADINLLYEWSEQGFRYTESNLYKLSIFKDITNQSSLGEYKFSLYCNEPLFYLGIYNKKNQGIFFDANKKIIFESRYYLSHLASFLSNIDLCLDNLRAANFSSVIEIHTPVVAIEKWFITYGHFKDEAYNLGAVLSDPFIPKDAIVLLDYPTDSRLNQPSFSFNSNYQKIERLIFESRALNAYNFKASVLKINKLFIFENRIYSKTFHSFPVAIGLKIKNSIERENKSSKFLYLTRSTSYRDILNKEEIEKSIKDEFFICSPENHSYESLVEYCDGAELVVMYYGSAMTNMCYFRPNTKVIILKSKAYSHETLELWNTLIANYQLRIWVIDADDSNTINKEYLFNIIDQNR
jgi:hypothetical protein